MIKFLLYYNTRITENVKRFLKKGGIIFILLKGIS